MANQTGKYDFKLLFFFSSRRTFLRISGHFSRDTNVERHQRFDFGLEFFLTKMINEEGIKSFSYFW